MNCSMAVDWDGGFHSIDTSNGGRNGIPKAADPEGDHGFNGLTYNQNHDVLVGVRDDHPSDAWDGPGEIEGDLYLLEWAHRWQEVNTV